MSKLKTIKELEASAERVFPSGAWRISYIVDGYLFQRVYYGYTKREAIMRFRQEIKEGDR